MWFINHLGTPLYSDDSEFDDKKFGFVMEKVLLPITLDYHVRSRDNEVSAVAAAELTNLNGDDTDPFNEAVQVWETTKPSNSWGKKSDNFILMLYCFFSARFPSRVSNDYFV